MDKRIERTHRNVRRAAIALLGERGYAAFNMEAVAEKAGVSKSTLYRHWQTKLSLIADALETLNKQPRPVVSQGNVRQRTCELLRHLTEALSTSQFAACIPALIEASERHDEVADFLHAYSARRRRALVDTLRSGIATGELPVGFDVEMASLALSGAIFYRRSMTADPFSAGDVPALVTLVLGDERPS